MRDYSYTHCVNYLVNLTSEPVSVYEETTGVIRTFPPQHISLPYCPDRSRHMCYIVSPEFLRYLTKHHRSLDDLAIVKHTDCGRGGALLSRLVWGKDPEARCLVFPVDKRIPVCSYR